MTMFPRVGEKRRIDDIGLEDEEAIGGLCRLSGRPVSPKTAMEQEKRIRREIANSNERRRMQSINAGFASLKTLLPHHEGEKLSKAAILQQTAEYIYQLEQEKTRLLSQNCQLKRLLNHQQHHADAEGSPAGGESPCDDGSSGGEVVVSTQVDGGGGSEDLRREMIDLRVQLDRERRHRMSLEEHLRSVEAPGLGFPERIKEVSSHPTTKVELREPKMESVPVPVPVPVTVPGQVTNVVEVTTTPRAPITTTTTTPASIKTEPLSPSTNLQIITSTPATAAPTTTTTSAVAPQAAVTTTTTTTAVIGQPPLRQAVLSRQALNANGHTTPIPTTVVSASPATTIVTVVPSAKGGIDALPSVFEALTAPGRIGGAKVEVEPAPRVPSPETTIEYVEDNKNHTVYIVNSTNAACQKSLDTICEAIRHLEGDHMFQTEDQHPRLEEEIITDETLTIEDHVGEQVTLAEEEPITLHMVGEPQEVPLELTTTHRPTTPHTRLAPPQTATISLNAGSGARLVSHPATRLPQASPTMEAVPVCSISTTTSSPSSTLLQPSRPGVIVVKHP